MIPVKICGITRLEDALSCIRHGVTALGFIFAPSKRRVTPDVVREICKALPPFIVRVGVFVDQDPWVIRDLLRDCCLDLAQLHGNEPVKDAEILEGRVIKAFHPVDAALDPIWRDAPLRAVLIDSGKSGSGGSGIVFDWNRVEPFRTLGFPLILAGGLHPGNVERAIRTVRPDGIDLAGGVEKAPGIKDEAMIGDLMTVLRRMESDFDIDSRGDGLDRQG